MAVICGSTALVKIYMERAIIFDFDGTLADSLPAVIDVFRELTGHSEPYAAEVVAKYRHLSLLELASELHVPKWKIPMLVVKGRRMLQKHLKDIRPHAGIHAMLADLQNSGERLYILSSNSSQNVNDYLQHHKLASYFTGVFGGVSLLGKAPRLNKLIESEKVDITNSWYVGDETRDVIAAHAVGLRIASVTWGYNSAEALALKQPDFIANTPTELLEGLRA